MSATSLWEEMYTEG